MIRILKLLLESRKGQSQRLGPLLKDLVKDQNRLLADVGAGAVQHAVEIREQFLGQFRIADVGEAVQAAANFILRALS